MTDLDLIPETSIGLWQANDFTGVIHEATQAADALGAVVKDRKLTVKIQGRHHVLVEGWTLLGTMLGMQPYVVWSRPMSTGQRQNRRSSDRLGSPRRSPHPRRPRHQRSRSPMHPPENAPGATATTTPSGQWPKPAPSAKPYGSHWGSS